MRGQMGGEVVDEGSRKMGWKGMNG